MKKTIITIMLATVAAFGAAAQTNDSIMQPTAVIGRVIDNDGTVTNEINAEFEYSSDGKLSNFGIPNHALSTTYTYSGDYMLGQHTWHCGGWPVFDERLDYSYANGRVSTISHLWGQMNPNEYWRYTYYDDGRLKEKDYKSGDDDWTDFYFYEYGEMTKTERYCTGADLVLKRKTTSQYDAEGRLVTSLADTYNGSGEVVASTMKSYTYNESGGLLEEAAKTLSDGGEWANTSIMRYVYDGDGNVTERQNGVWDTEDSEWEITKRITFETTNEGATYTVSFYKKSGGEWVWDEFANQTILFGAEYEWQQKALRYYVRDGMGGNSHISQFEFTMSATREPIYLNVNEVEASSIGIYPNPGKERLSVTSASENSVIMVYDINGRLIITRQFDFTTEIGTDNWPSGVYIWKVISEDGGETESGKWVKE